MRKDLQLKTKPLAALRGMRLGPACLHCGEPVPLRWARNGWIHASCESMALDPTAERIVQRAA